MATSYHGKGGALTLGGVAVAQITDRIVSIVWVVEGADAEAWKSI